MLAAVAATLLAAGCSSPNKANIELRKQIQDLQAKNDSLQRQHDSDQASIRAMQDRIGTLPTLPQEQLDKIVTVAGLKFGNGTGGYRPDPDKSGDTMLKVYVVPIDQEGDPIKAAGTFHIELFDLSLPKDNRIGQWDFDLAAAQAHWYAHAFLYTYVLDCPWQTVPTHDKLTAHVSFTDELTHRVFTVNRDVTVQPPPKP